MRRPFCENTFNGRKTAAAAAAAVGRGGEDDRKSGSSRRVRFDSSVDRGTAVKRV